MEKMRIEIYAEPKFKVPLTLEDVGVLKKLSKLHYDELCRAASVHGENGFLARWENTLTWRKAHPNLENPESDKQPLFCTWRELDISLKIMEFPPATLTEAETAIRNRLTNSFLGALRHANSVLPSWETVYSGETEVE